MPKNHHILFIGLNEEEYSYEFQASLTEKNIELASIRVVDIGNIIDDIRALDLDILFFCSPFWGHFLSRISLVGIARAAPLQIAYIGDVITTGLPSCDYFILPSESNNNEIRNGFTEKLLMIPHIRVPQFVFNAADDSNPAKKNSQLVVYFSHAHMWKLNGELIDTWAQIISRVDKSVMRLAPLTTPYHKSYLPVLKELISQKCKTWDIQPSRFEIIQDSGAGLMQSQMAQADIYLDSFPYTGSVSILETLAAGIPIVSLTGSSYPESLSRVVLSQFDLDQNAVVTSVSAYVARAVTLGQNAFLRQQEAEGTKRMVSQTKIKSVNRQFSEEFWDAIDRLLVKGQ